MPPGDPAPVICVYLQDLSLAEDARGAGIGRPR
jgi:hypothetical protein